WEKQKGSRGIRRGQWYRLVFQFPIRELVMDNSRAAEIEAMLMRLYVECDTGERRGNGSQSGVAMPSWQTVEEARVLLGVK
ncbi:hypothetical protein NP157_23545, partial [Salmonella enterica]|nr:hypothetical protein [Salmonella enterica]